jgi:prevent-host-death family protein
MERKEPPHNYAAAAPHYAENLPLISQPVILQISPLTEARSKLYRLIDEAASSHEPIVITGKRGSAVLISEDDWQSIQETIYLLNIPGMRESIREGLATPIEECSEELDW